MSTYRKTPEAVARLSPEQYRVAQESATEPPGRGELLDNHEPGIYVDIVSGEPLFASSAKCRAVALRSARQFGSLPSRLLGVTVDSRIHRFAAIAIGSGARRA